MPNCLSCLVLRWSAIATHLPKRTDNEIKNYWNTHLKKRLTKMGIDPITHKPKNEALLSNDGQSKNAANLSHMAQWESARLEAEARLVRQSKLRSNSLGSSAASHEFAPASNKPVGPPTPSTPPRCLDILKAGSMWRLIGVFYLNKNTDFSFFLSFFELSILISPCLHQKHAPTQELTSVQQVLIVFAAVTELGHFD